MDKNTTETGTEFIEALIDAYNSLKEEDKKEINIIAAEIYLNYVEKKEKQNNENLNINENSKKHRSKRLKNINNTETKQNNYEDSNETNLDDSNEENAIQQEKYQNDVVRHTSLLSSSLKSLAKIAGLK